MQSTWLRVQCVNQASLKKQVSSGKQVEMKGRIPARGVVIPGSYTHTDFETSLINALRDFNVIV
jgi:hypothetical protein